MKEDLNHSKDQLRKKDCKLEIEEFHRGMEFLESAFEREKMQDKSTKVYYRKIKYMTNGEFIQVVSRIVEWDDKFPRISDFNRTFDGLFKVSN